MYSVFRTQSDLTAAAVPLCSHLWLIGTASNPLCRVDGENGLSVRVECGNFRWMTVLRTRRRKDENTQIMVKVKPWSSTFPCNHSSLAVAACAHHSCSSTPHPRVQHRSNSHTKLDVVRFQISINPRLHGPEVEAKHDFDCAVSRCRDGDPGPVPRQPFGFPVSTPYTVSEADFLDLNPSLKPRYRAFHHVTSLTIIQGNIKNSEMVRGRDSWKCRWTDPSELSVLSIRRREWIPLRASR